MENSIFAERFRRAHDLAVPFTRNYVVQHLPDESRFLLYPNQSYDGNPLTPDQEVHPEDSLEAEQFLGPLSSEQAINWLWRDGKVPEWVNMSVVAQDDHFTYLELICCGRFTAEEKFLYHQHEGNPPFHVLGPALPAGWKEGDKFDLYSPS